MKINKIKLIIIIAIFIIAGFYLYTIYRLRHQIDSGFSYNFIQQASTLIS